MYVAALVVLPDGRILAGGHETHFPYGQSDGLAFTRLAADGTVDTTFGPAGNGLAITAIGEYAVTTAMAVDAAGRIVATGYAETDELPEDNPDYDVLVVRYDADGHLDATFGAGGTIATDIAGRQVGDWGLGLVLEPGGIVVAARSFRSATSSRTNGSLLRYLAD
jgi:uncharacterized delta-60 repeat protein